MAAAVASPARPSLAQFSPLISPTLGLKLVAALLPPFSPNTILPPQTALYSLVRAALTLSSRPQRKPSFFVPCETGSGSLSL